MSLKSIGVIAILGLLAGGCAVPQQTTRISMLQVPEVQEAAKYRSISVARFSGQNGEDLSLAIESAMMNARVQDKPVYGNVARAVASRSLKGDARSASTLAKSQGTDAILIGEVTAANVADSRRTTTEYVCTQYKDPKKFLSPCTAGYDKTVYCTDRKATMQVQVQLIDGKSGNAVYNEAITRSADSSACGDQLPEDGKKMLGSVMGAITGAVLGKLVPHDKMVDIALMDTDEAIHSKEKFNSALRFAKENRMDRACETFRELYENEKTSRALNYNLGVCEEAAAAFWRASEYYGIADQLSREPDKRLTAALTRNAQNIKNAGALADNRKDLKLQDRMEAGAAIQTITQSKTKAGKAPAAKAAAPSAPIDPEALMLDRRVALVIGNAKYRKSALLNPVNDARAMTRELRAAHFNVISVEDADLQKMTKAIDEFSRLIKKDGVALVFYAGHGMQVKGENFLIPVDADFREESEIAYKAINLGYILSKLEDAKSRVNIVMLDACRDNPFARSWRSGKGGGLASVDAPAGTLIAYATAPGKTAADGAGANGLYTSHLLQQLRVNNQKIEDVLKNTRKAVAAASRQEQIPWDSSSLTGDFYFRAGDQKL
jgi:hypothetical protein